MGRFVQNPAPRTSTDTAALRAGAVDAAALPVEGATDAVVVGTRADETGAELPGAGVAMPVEEVGPDGAEVDPPISDEVDLSARSVPSRPQAPRTISPIAITTSRIPIT